MYEPTVNKNVVNFPLSFHPPIIRFVKAVQNQGLWNCKEVSKEHNSRQKFISLIVNGTNKYFNS